MKFKELQLGQSGKIKGGLIESCTGGGATLVGYEYRNIHIIKSKREVYHCWDSDAISSDGRLSYSGGGTSYGSWGFAGIE
jgi:hypothetical protein